MQGVANVSQALAYPPGQPFSTAEWKRTGKETHVHAAARGHGAL